MTNSHKNIVNQFLESSALLIMTFPEIVESKDLLWGRTCAVDNVHARRKGVLGKLYEMQISSERGLRNSLKFPSYFGMEYVRPWNMGKKYIYPIEISAFSWISQPALFVFFAAVNVLSGTGKCTGSTTTLEVMPREGMGLATTFFVGVYPLVNVYSLLLNMAIYS